MRWWADLRTALGLPVAVPKPRRTSSRLPWWGLVLHSRDQQTLTALIDSAKRLQTTLETPGWQDVEAVINDWIDRYADQASKLGQRLDDSGGRLMLTEEDTPTDDRRRLIACAQAAALRGLLVELKTRVNVDTLLRKRQEQEKAIESGELV